MNTKGYLDMDLLRFTTAGSVDDGKSTLIGRLLYDSQMIYEDQLKSVLKDSKIKNANKIQELATEFEMNQKMPNTKNAAGLFLKKDMRLIDIFIGSEGVLGAFSEIEVGLIKRTNNSSTIVAFFDAVINALDFVDHIKTNPQKEPVLSLEFFDEHSFCS